MSWFSTRGREPELSQVSGLVSGPAEAAANMSAASFNAADRNSAVDAAAAGEPSRSVMFPANRAASFDFGNMNEDSVAGIEQPKKVLDMMFNRQLIDSKEIATRMKKIKDADPLLHFARRPDELAPVDPDSPRYRLWLVSLVLLASFTTVTTGYYLGARQAAARCARAP